MIYPISANHPSSLSPTSVCFVPPKRQVDRSSYVIGCLTGSGEPVYIQPPEGMLHKKDQQKQEEWVFTMIPETPDDVFGDWMAELTAHACTKLYENRNQWFSNSNLKETDIIQRFCSEVEYDSIPRTANINVVVASNMLVFVEGVSTSVQEHSQWDSATIILEIVGVEYINSTFRWILKARQASTLRIPRNQNDLDFNTCVIKPTTIIPMSKPESKPESKPMSKSESKSEAMTESMTESKTESNPESKTPLAPNEYKESVVLAPDDGLSEVYIDDENLEVGSDVVPRNEVYYAQYKEAIRRANEAKELAINTYLEARKIKDTYLLDYMTESEDEWDDEDDDEEEEDEEEV